MTHIIDTEASQPGEPTRKFALLVDFGIITVPDDYLHSKQLDTFRGRHFTEFFFYDRILTDESFPNPSRILKPGDKLRARAFQPTIPGMTSSAKRMAFLATQKGIYTGAQGASLLYEQKRDQLPRGKWYASFDVKKRLWKGLDGSHGVPGLYVSQGGDFEFRADRLETHGHIDDTFLCFSDVE